ncbi:NusG domain II-containing protein [Streptococcus hillyeri]|uniref:NusG domain II-containing protein n=1 Tax=Streptococcus hillyeri TaxID=2282420 RepID=A0A3L9E2J6_9STRE|nr:NusG domain II-containing protein [Streptococcus hillyeri]RLY05370.1 NusG domain II-containing protein [Streptococcus hillyeri]
MKKSRITLLEYFKPFDYLFISLAIILSFLPLGVTWYRTAHQESQPHLIAIVKIQGEIVDEFPLSEGGEHFEKTYYPAEGQYNIVEVDGSRIRVREDNSPDQIAVNTGWIQRAGQFSICLPHQLIIEIVAPEDSESDEEELILPL